MPAPQNTRIYYATESVGIAPFNSPSSFTAVRGVQNVGLDGRITIQYIHEVGNLPTYDSFEDIPEVEVNIEKALDGYCPAYLLATDGAASADIAGRSTQRCHVALSVHRDNLTRASGNQLKQLFCSGMYVGSVGYNFNIEGAFQETVQLVGNNREWATANFTFTGMTAAEGVTSFSPAAPEGVNRRQHLVMEDCLFPVDIPGIEPDNTNIEVDVDGSVQFATSFESIRVAANFGRTPKRELGRKNIYFRHVDYPVEVTCEFTFYGKEGDQIDFLEDGTLPNGDNTSAQPIKLVCEEGLVLDLGNGNRLSQLSHSGASAGDTSQDVMLTFSYANRNELTVTHSNDITVALRP